MSLLSRGVMAQKNNDSDQQTEIAVRQLQPPHTQAGSQTHRHATFTYQEKHKTFFSWANCWESLWAGQREPRCLEGEDSSLGWSVEPGKAMERVAAPGLPFTLRPGMTKPWLVPAEPGLEAQLCAGGTRISHLSSPLGTELRKLCWGVGRAVLSSAGSVRARPLSPPFFLPLGGGCCSP